MANLVGATLAWISEEGTIERAAYVAALGVLLAWVLWLAAYLHAEPRRSNAQNFYRGAAGAILVLLGLYAGARLTFVVDLAVVWEPVTVDRVAFGTFVVFGLFFVLWASALAIPDQKLRQDRQTLYVGLGGAIVSALTLYVGYTTFRASNMLGALQYISDQGNNIGDMETDSEEVLCLYRWGEKPTENLAAREFRGGCGDEIFVDRERGELTAMFDDMQLYVEETILFAMESRVYKDRYGADFYQGLEYWIDDFSEDWTGAVSYYVISREMDHAAATHRTSIDPRSLACLERFTRIRINNVCGKYYWFLDRLGEAGNVSRRPEMTCDVPDELSPLLDQSGEPYSCEQSYWGESFRGL